MTSQLLHYKRIKPKYYHLYKNDKDETNLHLVVRKPNKKVYVKEFITINKDGKREVEAFIFINGKEYLLHAITIDNRFERYKFMIEYKIIRS